MSSMLYEIDTEGIPEDLKMELLNNYSSLPMELREFIQIHSDEIIDSIKPNTLILDKRCKLVDVFDDELIKIINQPLFSDIEADVCDARANIDSQPISSNSKKSLHSLLDTESYDINSFIKFEKLCHAYVARLNPTSDIRYVIESINNIITPLKIKALSKLQPLLNKIDKKQPNILGINTDDDRLLSSHDRIMEMINKGHIVADDLSLLLYLYKKTMPNEDIPIEKYKFHADIKSYNHELHKEVDDVMARLENEDLTYNQILARIPKDNIPKSKYTPKYNKIEQEPNSTLLCESTRDRLIFGDISNSSIDNDNIINMIKRLDGSVVSNIVKSGVCFDINERLLTMIMGLGMEVVTVMIKRTEDNILARHVVIYDSRPYLLYTVDKSKGNIFGITIVDMDDESLYDIISIKDTENSYDYICEL